MHEFARGQKLTTAAGLQLAILEKLGEGGQGIVYRVEYRNQQYALKWYFPGKIQDITKFYYNIKNNIKHGAPTKAFLWPVEITEFYEGSFGYLMELRPDGYQDFSMFLLAKVRFSSIHALVTAALNITNSFRLLHNRGFSYQDLNDGNFFVNAQNGDVLICDNDNVAPYGSNLGIAGKCRYMAPEVVLGKKLPDIHTDRFSLAVILYMLLFLNHPLEGKRTMCPCLTEELEHKFYGREPIFVYDPVNDANRPVRGVHMNEMRFWPCYPSFIHSIFQEAFSYAALLGDDIEHRVQEKKWQEVLIMLRDSILCCSCKDETFIELDKSSTRCMNCGREIKQPLLLKVKKYQVVLHPGNKLYQCHTSGSSDIYQEVTGEIITSRSDPSVIGIRNLSDTDWNAVLPNGTEKLYPKDSVVKIIKGLKIIFSQGTEGEML